MSLALDETISLQQDPTRDLRNHFRAFRNSRWLRELKKPEVA